MKRLLLLPLWCVISLKLCAQAMPTVAGVTFGDSYAKCKQILDNKFNGGQNSYQSTTNELTYYEISFGGFYFDYAEFSFQSDGTRTYLYMITFYQRYELNEAEKAKHARDMLVETYSQKYEYIGEKTNDDGFKLHLLGTNPRDEGYAFVVIGTEKGKTKNGEMRLWTKVCYGPIVFVRPEDEI